MAYSGVISGTTFNTDKVLRSAVRRTKLPAAQITSEHWSTAQDCLYLQLSDLANQGVPLWCIQKQLYPLYEGQGAITLDVGTVDVLNQFFRTTSELSGTETETASTFTIEFEDLTEVSTIGLFWDGASPTVALERSDDGLSWTTVQTETPDAASGQTTWYDLDAIVASLFFRVRATSGNLNADTVYFGNNISRIPLARMNRDDFTNLVNPAFLSDRVLQFWFDRQTPQPIMRLWPLPGTGALTAQIEVWRHRQIMDVGTLTQEIEVPQRWYEAIVSGLARKLAREFVEVDPKVIPMLDKDAADALYVAQAEEYDNSPVMIAPNISAYTK